MQRSIAPVVLSTLLAAGCLPSVPLSRDESVRLSSAPPVVVVSVRSPPPWVDCPNDEGMKVWEYPSSANWGRGTASPPVLLASGAASPLVVPAGGTWATIEDQWTESLQKPPIDPAQATAAHILSQARDVALPVHFAEPVEEVRRVDRASLRDRFPGSPVLVVEAVRWVLVGCFFTYQPWFDVQATLFRPSTAEILWRDSCGGPYPDGSPTPASRDELEAWGRRLYARVIEDRAAACAAQLVASLGRAGRS